MKRLLVGLFIWVLVSCILLSVFNWRWLHLKNKFSISLSLDNKVSEDALRVQLYDNYEGFNEANQFEYYNNLSNTRQLPSPNSKAILHSFKYSVTVKHTPKIYGEALLLEIHETSDVYDKGGSSFNIWIKSDSYLDRCWSTDHFNGIYSDINNLDPFLKQISKITVCVNGGYPKTEMTINKLPVCALQKQPIREQTKSFKWVWSGNDWHIGTSNCTVPLLPHKDACRCSRKFSYVIGIGSSHMISNLDWLMESCGFNVYRLPR